MEIKFVGEMSLKDFRQAVYEKLNEIEETFAIHHSRGGTLYINPTDGLGQAVTPRGTGGQKISKLLSTGPYRSAADELKL